MKIENTRRRGVGRNPLHRFLPAAPVWLALFAAAFVSAPAFAQDFHGASIQKNPLGPDGTPRAHVGDTIMAAIRVRNLDDFNDTITVTSIVDVVNHNSGSVTSINLLPAPVTLTNFGESVIVNHAYPVLPGDGPVLTDDGQSGGIDNHDGDMGTGFPQDFFVTFPGQVQILTPAIRINETCVFIGTPDNPLVAFFGVVSNAGNIVLSNVVVTSSHGNVIPIGTLDVSQTATYSNVYVAVSDPSINTVTATGHDPLFGFSQFSTVTDTAICQVDIPCNPQIKIVKLCGPAVPVGSSLTITGVVANSGDVTLVNVTVHNDQPAPNTLVFGPATLAPGSNVTFTFSYTAPAPAPGGPCQVTDTLRASGTAIGVGCSQTPTDAKGLLGRIVTASATATCPLLCQPPCIDVIKEIAGSVPGGCGTNWGKVCTGARDTEGNLCPSFCYRITISNCTDSITLTNVTVIDNRIDLSGLFPTILQPNGTFSVIVSNVTHCNNTTNVVTATGQSAESGQTVTDSDFAVALVREAAITCSKSATSPDAVPTRESSPQFLVLPDDGNPHSVTFTVTVRNNGDVPLTGITVSDPVLAAFDCPGIPPFSLGVGESTNITLCTTVLDCSLLPLTNRVTVVGVADAITGELCTAYDSRSNVLIGVSTTCEAIIACQPPAGCRTTGGGRQPGTSTFPRVRYVTHGGQVGAPVGNETHFDPDSVCIQGNWQHVRHLQGGLRGNFHAKTFDSLMCACLACDGGTGTVVGELCNPGNRPCGPEPRKAPANKITFSGVGDYTLTNGRRTPRSVIFRVDIEDRSEPGGSHPKGGKPPADRYRIRIWVLTSAELALLNDPNNRLLTMREAIAATTANTALKDGAVKLDGVTPVDLGTAVFGIRPPDIDDGGELERGNRQIHPSIKLCP
jgi:hypothetical protein